MLNERTTTGKAIVIGAGTMGGGIAAHLANAGWQVSLLDVAGGDPKARSAAASAGLDRVKKNKPALLYVSEFAERIRPGNVEDDLGRLAEADWVIEAVSERMDLKQRIWATVEQHVGPHTLLSTNTSGLSLAEMTAGLNPETKRRFLGTHFFNPPRYLKLVELITLPETDPAVARHFTGFCERVLGRRVVRAKDTPGFISNRIGMWVLLDTLHLALEMGLTVEEVDFLTGPLIGRPKSGTCRLADIIGFDVVADVARNQYERLPGDAFRDRLVLPEPMERLMADGRIGEKSGAGFYRREGKQIMALDWATLEYRPREEPVDEALAGLAKRPLAERLKQINTLSGSRGAEFLQRHFASVTRYAEYVAAEVADDADAIDQVMMWGFNWEIGPLALSDTLGSPRFFLLDEGRQRLNFATGELEPAPADPHYLRLEGLAQRGRVVAQGEKYRLIDLCDEVLLLEFRSKMNTFSPELTDAVNEARERAEHDFCALVIGNQGPHFSAGFDLKLFLAAIDSGRLSDIDTMLHDLQSAFMGLKYAKVPVVAAPFGYTLGAGCECSLHCAAVQAGAELMMGLPEVNVGVAPAGGGAKEMLARAMEKAGPASDPFPFVEAAYDQIIQGKFSGSAAEARKKGFLRDTDGITINPDRLLYDAKRRALALADGWAPPTPKPIWVGGADYIAQLKMPIHWHYRQGVVSEQDRTIAHELAFLMSGGALPAARPVSEEYLLKLEREVFLRLCEQPELVQRMRNTVAR